MDLGDVGADDAVLAWRYLGGDTAALAWRYTVAGSRKGASQCY